MTFLDGWRDGLAFNALIHGFRPDLIDRGAVLAMDPEERCANAFDVAEEELDCDALLDEEEIDDWHETDVLAYVSEMYKVFK